MSQDIIRRRRWYQLRLPRPGHGVDISALLDAADGAMPLPERHLWLVKLMDWIRAGEPVSGVRYVLRQLDQVPERRAKVVALLAAFWRDIDMAALLADFGFTARNSLLHELAERLRGRLLPLTPATTDLATLFAVLFTAEDARWLAELDDATLDDLARLWSEVLAHATTSPLGWREPFYDAIMFLASQVRAAGFSRELRTRMGMRVDQDFGADGPRAEGLPLVETNPSVPQAFRQITHVAERLHDQADLAARQGLSREDTHSPALQEAQYLRALLDTCVEGAQGIHEHLESTGISVNLVYQIDQLTLRCQRIDQLLACVLAPEPGPELRALVVELIDTAERRRSIRDLFRQHYSMLARKMAERSAETGEHYITRTGSEYLTMLGRASGGGAVMAVTTYIKFALLALGLSPFWAGLAAGGNYAISFVVIQLLHFTVATKQPAMTAPAMAHRLKDTHTDEAVEGFVDQVAHLMRSQVAGIIGNLFLVAPVVLIGQVLAWWLLGKPLIDRHTAEHVLDNLTLLGGTPWYAAFTGVLLFTSSMLAGWLENWFVLNRLDSALRWNPRIRGALGARFAERSARWWRANISGLGSNISLGLMLGLVPVIAGFFAAPLDVRHVTLSTGQLAAAIGTLGWDALEHKSFWWCVAGLPVTAMLNVGVSFTLALRVAMRSRGVRVKDRARLQAAILRRLLRRPLSFLLPPRQ